MKLNVLLPSSKIIILEVETSDTIANIKKQVQDSFGLVTTENWVLCQGIKLHDTWTFEDYDISDNFQIEFDRPRTLDIKTHEVFGAYTRRIYRLLGME
jgi:hypothetical protein